MHFLTVALSGLPHVLPLSGPLAPREPDIVRTGGHEDPSGHARVHDGLGLVHVLGLHLVILGAADLRGVDLLAIDRDHERVRCLVTLDARVPFFHAAHETSEQLVFGVGGKHMTDLSAATSAERQPFDVSALAELATDRIFRGPWAHVGIADRQRADALRRCQIALEEQRRSSQRGGDVVEPEVGAVARQQFGDVNVEGQQIANRVAVLGPVQPMDDVAAGRALAPPCLIERAREPRGEGRVLGFRGSWHVLRWHCAHAQFPEHAFPRRRLGQQVVQASGLEIDRVVGRLRRAAVVAADAVLLDPGLMLRGVRR